MFQQSKFGSLLGVSAAILGGISASKKGKDTKNILITAALLGVGGYFLGNALSKFVEPASV